LKGDGVDIDPLKRDLINKSEDEIIEYLKQLENAVGKPHLQMQQHQDFKVNIHPDTKISPAMFKPSKVVAGEYFAHPLTIAALKKNIFMAGDEFEDLEIPHQCESCNTQLDVQFWHFCPYCGEKFPF
jgi:hypothetical protein